ncbi:large neutral amino acids transporter small subunit 1 [Xylariales sp. AK1849]|nr:large neutral amino acids transporter small subunit 1 [Xylariales sp. AK1849]
MPLNDTIDHDASLSFSDDNTPPSIIDHDPTTEGNERGPSTGINSAGARLLRDASPPFNEKKLSFLDGLALVISLQIGSGIFAAPSQVTQNVPSAAVGLVVWVLAGLLVWTGAASFIELGLQIPVNGGVQEYLRECYGDFVACAFTWTWIGISRPSSMALIAGIFADYLSRAAFPKHNTSWLLTKAVGLAGLWIITYINCTGARVGAKIARAFLFLKLLTLFCVTALGFGATMLGTSNRGNRDPSGWSEHDPPSPDFRFPMYFKNLVDALFAALFCYAGWETIGFVLGDMAQPTRHLPRVMTAAMTIVMVGFVMVNISLYIVLPLDALRETSMPVMVFAEAVLGPPAVVVFSLMIAASCLGALNANVYATATLCVAASHRGYLPKILETKPLPSARTCIAMIVNSVLASVFFCLGTFAQLVSFKGIVEYFFFLFTILGVFVLRRRHRSETNTLFRTKTWNPIIFSICSAVVVVRGIFSNYGQGIALVLTISLSYVIYLAKQSDINQRR